MVLCQHMPGRAGWVFFGIAGHDQQWGKWKHWDQITLLLLQFYITVMQTWGNMVRKQELQSMAMEKRVKGGGDPISGKG